MRVSRGNRGSIDMKAIERSIEELLGMEEELPDNFSEGYESINDNDSEADDISPAKRKELFRRIKQMSNPQYDDNLDGLRSREHLVPLKGFKEYKLSLEQEEEVVSLEKKPVSKLRPLRFQEFRARGQTEKKIKGNV
jgi:hypothetical protein